MGTVTVMAVPTFFRSIQETAIKRVIVDLQTLQFQIDVYERLHERLPDTLDDIQGGNRFDHWGHPYEYLPNTSKSWNGKSRKDHNLVPLNSDYDLYSVGPDGESRPPLTAKASRDDIVRSDDGRYIGPVLEN